MPSFVLTTLGCKVNQYDGAVLAAALTRAGLETFSPAGAAARPDLVVIHTCCITAAAMAKSRHALRRALRVAPDAAVLIAGCYARLDPRRLAAELASLGLDAGRAIVAASQDNLDDHVRQLAERLGLADGAGSPTHAIPDDARLEEPCRGETRRQPGASDCLCSGDDRRMSAQRPLARAAGCSGADIRIRRRAAVKRALAFSRGSLRDGTESLAISRTPGLSRFPGHQRAFVKVQDGCDAFCAYCVVPYTRPLVQWRPLDLVEDESRRLLRAGHKELVLCGVFLGAYGHLTARRRQWGGEPSLLPQLARRIGGLQGDGLWRLRLSSLEPGDLSEELLAAFAATPATAWHFHLPLQSGSGRILRRMNRQYAPDDFRRAIDRLRAAMPDAAVTTDIVVGFPGEDEADFHCTMELARHAGFSKIHAFPFSAIEGTAAWTYRHEAPPPKVVRERLAELAALERELATAYRAKFVGRTMEALVESPSRRHASVRCHASTSLRGEACGQALPSIPTPGQAMTDRYLTVFFSDPAPRPGEVHSFRIEDVHLGGLTGRFEVRG